MNTNYLDDEITQYLLVNNVIDKESLKTLNNTISGIRSRNKSITREKIYLDKWQYKSSYELSGFSEDILSFAGFQYIPEEDIISAKPNCVQHSMKYCKLYDDTAFCISSVIDSEPVYFDYRGERWMIEMWKGQYGLQTGSEIGIYKNMETDDEDMMTPPELLVYDCVKDHDFMKMSSMTIRKKGEERIFNVTHDRHWWLTGFKWGEYSEPEDIAVEYTLHFNDSDMLDCFRNALNAGHIKSCSGNEITILFSKPFSKQPESREKIRTVIQAANKWFVDKYRKYKRDHDITTNNPEVVLASLSNEAGKEYKMLLKWILLAYRVKMS